MAKQNQDQLLEAALAEQAEAMGATQADEIAAYQESVGDLEAAQAEEIAAYQERVEDLETAVAQLEELLTAAFAAQPAVATSATVRRKDQVLALMISGKHWKISDLAKAVGINERNISSQLTYLRKAGYAIATDSLERKFIEV